MKTEGGHADSFLPLSLTRSRFFFLPDRIVSAALSPFIGRGGRAWTFSLLAGED